MPLSMMSKVCLGLVFVWALFDVSQRMVPSDTSGAADRAQDDRLNVGFQVLTTDQVSGVADAYKAFSGGSAEQASTPDELSAAFQASQNGKLTSLFAGSSQLQLKAVVLHDDRYALVETREINKNNAELIKLSLGQEIESYKVTDLGLDYVQLTSNDGRVVSLQMYESPK